MTEAVEPSIIAQATALLRKLTPDDLRGDDNAEVVALREAGIRLFGRAVLHARYGEQDVVTFLREQAGNREMLRRLERLQKQINKEHEKAQRDSQKSGINLARKATLDAIEASAAGGESEYVGKNQHCIGTASETAGSSGDSTALALAPGVEAAPPPAGGPRLPPRARTQIHAEAAEGKEALVDAASLPVGSFRRACGVCKKHYTEVHHFYHRLCPACADFNYEKRQQTADLSGHVALVTGGRVRIGYEIVLKLLRAGCHVVCTTRFPADAAARYAAEPDAADWSTRLEVVGPLELAHVQQVSPLMQGAPHPPRAPSFALSPLLRALPPPSRALPPPSRASRVLTHLPLLPHTHPLFLALPYCSNLPEPSGTFPILPRFFPDPSLILPRRLARANGLQPPHPLSTAVCLCCRSFSRAARRLPRDRLPGWLQVELFCTALRARFGRLHYLINNAAQTLTRDPGWFHRMDRLEMAAAEALSPAARKLLSAGSLATPLLHQPAPPRGMPRTGAVVSTADSVAGELSAEAYMELSGSNDGGAIVPLAALPLAAAATTAASAGAAAAGVSAAPLSASELAAFPAGKLDETRQPLDLSHATSWSRRLGEVSTPELLHTLAANAVAPFILCSALRPALAPASEEGPYGHIINVSALEGKFAVGKKGAGHPHTNMSKAALNMLTLTSATSLFQERILVNAVDTGWVTDMAPGGVGAVAATHATHVGPPLDAVDGAARVLDPIFSHAKAPRTWLVRGKFWKDYAVSNW